MDAGTIGSLLSALLSAVAVATLVGLAVGRGALQNLRERLADARAEVLDLDRRLKDRDARITALEADVEALRRVVTGEAHWVALEAQLDDHHRQAQLQWGNTHAALGVIATELRRMRGPTP